VKIREPGARAKEAIALSFQGVEGFAGAGRCLLPKMYEVSYFVAEIKGPLAIYPRIDNQRPSIFLLNMAFGFPLAGLF
jgi:hypothetical protein